MRGELENRFCRGIGGIYLRKFVDDIDTDLPDPSSPLSDEGFQGLKLGS